MPAANNRVLEKMLDRLLASLTSGPSLNCRPHHSRQRVDFAGVAKLADLSPEDALDELLGNKREVKLTARVPAPAKRSGAVKRRGWKRNGNGEDESETTAEADASAEPISVEEKAWNEQAALLTKFRIIADDARTYEQDTGVHVLNLGFPILSLPPGTFAGGASRSGASRRVLAPIAFIPVTVTIGGGAAQSVKLACRGEGLDLVTPNVALLAWLEQQTGKSADDLFADEQGDDPWREISELVKYVCGALDMEVPAAFKPKPDAEAKTPQDGAATAEQIQPPPAEIQSTSEPVPTPAPPDGPQLQAADEENSWGLTFEAKDAAAQATESEVDRSPSTRVPRPDDAVFLRSCPRTDDDENPKPAVLVSAVVGLFPMANQGLLRDMQAMVVAGPDGLEGPVKSFVDVGASFEEAPPRDADAPQAERVAPRTRVFADERLVTAADPCQSRAVRLARQSRGLVVHGPPGTGKSQTIANIIGDHLARGQRVLLVCDKRTALDVVADRLDHMGLGQLCALIHDPQRDQRDLYMDIRQQLETLPEAITDEKAEGKLAKADAELQKLHGELTAHHQALMSRGGAGESTGMSFHELVGEWLALAPKDVMGSSDDSSHAEGAAQRSPGSGSAEFVTLNATLLSQTSLTEVDLRATELRDLLERAESVTYATNPWTKAAGLTLQQLLGKSIDAVRSGMAATVHAAREADATADVVIPAFAPGSDVTKVAKARVDLADRLEKTVAKVEAATAAHWANADDAARQRGRQQLAEAEPFAKLFRAGPLDAELALSVRENPRSLTIIHAQLATLAAYLEVARKWWSFFAFKQNKEAAGVLNTYGLTRSAENAERVRTFLTALRARLVLREHLKAIGPQQGESATLPADDRIERQLTDHAAMLDLLQSVAGDPLVAR